MTQTQFAQAATLSSFLSLTSLAPTHAGVVVSGRFEAPAVSRYSNNTLPSGGKWIGATVGFGATNRKLHNEGVIWPAATGALTTDTMSGRLYRTEKQKANSTSHMNLIK
jgi:hypothetical protein